jgi:hypothetical protein
LFKYFPQDLRRFFNKKLIGYISVHPEYNMCFPRLRKGDSIARKFKDGEKKRPLQASDLERLERPKMSTQAFSESHIQPGAGSVEDSAKRQNKERDEGNQVWNVAMGGAGNSNDRKSVSRKYNLVTEY